MTSRAGAWLALLALATVPYLPGLDGDFIEDDRPIIRDRVELRDPARIPELFTHTYWRGHGTGGLYRPLTVASYAVDRVVWGEQSEGEAPGPPAPRGVHGTNLILHVLATLLVLGLLRRRGLSPAASWIGSALFAAHPVHVEPVVHMVGRADLLMTVLLLAAFVLHDARRRWARALAPVCFLAALLSKEMAVVLPALLLADAVVRRDGRPWRSLLGEQARRLAPHLVVVAGYLAARGAVLGASLDPPRAFAWHVEPQYVALAGASTAEVVLTMTAALGEYLRLLLWPLRLSADYSGFPRSTTVSAPVALSAAALVVLAALVIGAWRRGRREPAFWLGWFLLCLAPVSNLVVRSGIVLAERVLYLPSLAVCGAAALAAEALVRRAGAVRAVSIGLALVLILAARSGVRAPVWSDRLTLFQETVRSGEHYGHVALTSLVGEYVVQLARGDADEPGTFATLADGRAVTRDELAARALVLARRSVAGHRNVDNVHQLAMLLELEGHLEECLPAWEELAAAYPDDGLFRERVLAVRSQLSVAARDLGDWRAAWDHGRGGLARVRADGTDDERRAWTSYMADVAARALPSAVAAQTWPRAFEMLVELERSSPTHPLVARHRLDILRGAVASWADEREWLRALDAANLLRRFAPGDETLRRHHVPILEGALGAFLERGDTERGRRVATELVERAPGHPEASAFLETQDE